MKFNSIKEYFYKLYNICYALTLLPLAVFIYLYLEVQNGNLISPIQDSNDKLIVQASLVSIILTILTIVHLVVKKNLKRLLPEVSLGNRMDGYYAIALARIGWSVASCLISAIGFYLVGNELFSVLFLAILVSISFQWPTPRRLCADLKLKGDEKELILYKRDKLV
jgi:hypothetical protein